MRLMKVGSFIFICFSFLTVSSPVFAKQIREESEKEYSGIIRKFEWAKSSASYCQAGSDYYVLETDEGVYALNSERDPIIDSKETYDKMIVRMHERMEGLVGQKVKLKGKVIGADWSEAEHCRPREQCIQGGITCSWIRTLEIEKI